MAPSSYSSYNRAAPLRKKRATATLSRGTAVRPPSIRVGSSTTSRPAPKPAVRPLTKAAVAPTLSPLPGAPSLQAVPKITPAAVGPPPQSLQSASDRTDIRENYGQGMNDINRGIFNAALAYGGVDNVQQFGFDPTGADTSTSLGVTHNPADNSALSVIARNLTAQDKNIDETAGAQNTFFSSNRLTDLQNTNDEADRQRAAAKKDYEDSMATYISNLTGLRRERDTGLRNADISDITAASAVPPENQQGAAPVDTPAPPAATAPAAAPKTGFKYVMDHGPNAGLSYNLVLRNGAYWRKYEDGRLVPR
jgi:hypothetical protein